MCDTCQSTRTHAAHLPMLDNYKTQHPTAHALLQAQVTFILPSFRLIDNSQRSIHDQAVHSFLQLISRQSILTLFVFWFCFVLYYRWLFPCKPVCKNDSMSLNYKYKNQLFVLVTQPNKILLNYFTWYQSKSANTLLILVFPF